MRKGGAPTITPSPSKIEVHAQVLHQSEEDDLKRHIEKMLESTESFSFDPSKKRKILLKHIIKDNGTFRITSKRITLYLTGISMCQDPTIRYLTDTHNS
jgi:hypothetical protein